MATQMAQMRRLMQAQQKEMNRLCALLEQQNHTPPVNVEPTLEAMNNQNGRAFKCSRCEQCAAHFSVVINQDSVTFSLHGNLQLLLYLK